ncbi:gamma-glutamyltransferase family protein [Roseomonas oryzicola]|uniref:Gamma-glutamyltransferase family protein n=1 Tax=Neoroseomonas oryzicola TaxID=535904 RepID=A0A9X9WCH2_9PROT|nr:gamma-glutamyltransferase family protein [Neoroseomonas oryzicola]MBR0658032.1 gamma-glutamyltransferase family protein [Neoroseomonas oryzicola]NKE15439.1 gamma-glutamyltransferase family protein [Neoroseomonas oryzicola]
MFTTRPEIIGTFGAVASTHWLASQVGMAVLERGGNAFDAAVAAGFTLQIVEPHLNGPGGDCPIILHSARTGRQEVICGQGPAPSGLTVGYLRDHLGLDLVPGTGLLATPVPGAFDAWMVMLRDHGSWTVRDVLAYAIGYARHGAPMVPRIRATIESVRPLFEAEWKTSAALWLRDGGPEPNGVYANPTLADTYERVVREAEAAGGDRVRQIEAARTAWYRGFVAEAIARFAATTEAMDTSGRRHRGVLNGGDLARWSATVEAPLTLDYRGHTVLKCGPWSQGPAMLQTLALMAGFDVDAMDPVGAEFIHHVVEAQKLAFADREAFYGDPDFVDVPMRTLLSKAYNDARRALIGPEASMDFRPGSPDGRAPRTDYAAAIRRAQELAAAAGSGEPTVSRLGAAGGDTCHVDVIDAAGNMVSATPSAGWLQSSPAIPELGFCLGSRCQMFWLDETLPNGLQPGKRPRTTLSPSMVLRDGKPWMSFGTPGGEQQDQWQPIMLLRMIHHGMNIQQAIDLPSFHSEHWISSFWPRGAKPGKVVIEGRYAPEVLQELNARGHLAEMGGEWSEGRLTGVRREADGTIRAGANPRGMQGYAVGR